MSRECGSGIHTQGENVSDAAREPESDCEIERGKIYPFKRSRVIVIDVWPPPYPKVIYAHVMRFGVYGQHYKMGLAAFARHASASSIAAAQPNQK